MIFIHKNPFYGAKIRKLLHANNIFLKNVAFTQHSTLNGLLMSIKSEFSKDFAGEDGGKFEGDLVDHLFHYHLLAIDDVDALLRF